LAHLQEHDVQTWVAGTAHAFFSTHKGPLWLIRLRAAEVVGFKVSDIDNQRMRIRVEQGKGRRDRDALLSPHLLATLRNWWKVARPPVWLFPKANLVFSRRRHPEAVALLKTCLASTIRPPIKRPRLATTCETERCAQNAHYACCFIRILHVPLCTSLKGNTHVESPHEHRS
jgi:integrase